MSPAYTVLSDGELRELLGRFGVMRMDAAEPMTGGLGNSSYLVRAGDERLVLTVCDDKSLAEVEQLVLLLSFLERQGFPANRLLPCGPGGEALHTSHQGKAVLLKRFIPGVTPAVSTPGALAQVGEALARLHALEYRGPLPDAHAYGLEHYGEAAQWGVEHDFIGWIEERSRRFAARLDPDLPRGLIHSDAWPENTVFEEDRLAAVIDFEEACRYFLLFDLAMCIIGSCVEGGRFRQHLVAALLEGYQRGRPLTPAEREQLPLHVEYAAATSAFWRFRQFHVRVPDPARGDLYREMAALAEEARRAPVTI